MKGVANRSGWHGFFVPLLIALHRSQNHVARASVLQPGAAAEKAGSPPFIAMVGTGNGFVVLFDNGAPFWALKPMPNAALI